MGISFTEPLWLLLLVPALALTIGLHLAARRRMGAGRRRTALVIRSILLSALVLAIAGFQLVLPVDRLATVFVVDLSDSVGNAGRSEALAFLRETLKDKPQGDVAGIVAFGKDALVERLPSELDDIDRIASAPVESATDIGAALRLATALFPDDSQKRIVLLSDGNDTTGGGAAEASLAASRGIRIETKAIGLGNVDEVLVERLTTPSIARLGESVQAIAEIRSSVAQAATVRLFADGALVATQPVQLEAGVTRVTFDVKPTEAGFHTFRVVVEAARDTFSQNDRADSNTIVKGEPRTLILAGNDQVASQLVAALKAQRQQVDTMVPEALPSDLAGLASYDSVVLVDVPRIRLNDKQLAALQVYVRDLGKGLVMVGGEDSYGAGGYQKTPLEESLPVDMGVRDRQKQPDIALVVVIDKSGSMAACHCNTFDRSTGSSIAGVQKVDIGKEAILRAAAAMTERDELGVVAFNESAHWVVHTQPLGTVGDLQGQLAAIKADGQTNIYSGLDEAVKSLEGVTATRRHIILLTDGWSTSGQYDDILKKMKADGITLSTVGAGGGANPFLEQLATQGGGRFYPAPNPASIPDIFLKETQQVSGQQIIEEPFFPIQTSSSPILRGLDQGLPKLLGYNGTTAKPAAQTVLVTSRDDPLLAQWQYGLGRSVAWTSDSTGRWAKDWLAWPGFDKFFSQLVSWTFPGDETDGIEATFQAKDGRTSLHIESVEADGSPRDFYQTHAVLVGPDLEPHDVALSQVAPGEYEATLGEVDPGAYAIRVTQTKPGSSPLGRTVGLVAPTSAEYRLLGTDEAFLGSLRAATGGTVVTTALQPWVHDLQTTSHFTDLWPVLLILALLLWPLDIALRRVSVGRREVALARAWVRGLSGRRRATAPRTASGASLLAARQRATGAPSRASLRESGTATAEPAGAAAAPTSGATAPLATSSVRPSKPAAPPAKAEPTPAPPRAAPTPAPAAPDEAADTLTKLRDAKRARGR
jgi:uncharacterized membrane protein